MSLAERIRAALTERNASPAVIQAKAAAESAQRQLEEDQRQSVQAAVLAYQQKMEQEKETEVQLRDLLKLIGAREQLQEVKKAWQAGRIDRNPEYTSETDYKMDVLIKKGFAQYFDVDIKSEDDALPIPKAPVVSLALRHRFIDTEEITVQNYYDNQASHFCTGELSLQTIVGFGETGLPLVATVYRYAKIPCSNNWRIYIGGERHYFGKRANEGITIIDYKAPEIIDLNNRVKSKEVLEGQLLAICTTDESFLDIENRAKQNIFKNRDFPWRVRQRASSDGYMRVFATGLDLSLNWPDYM